MDGQKYLSLRATILHMQGNLEAKSSGHSLSFLKKEYTTYTGCTVELVESGTLLTLAKLLIFGPSLDGRRFYRLSFRDKINKDLIRRIYRNLAKKTMGKVYTSGALSRASVDKILQLRTNELTSVLV